MKALLLIDIQNDFLPGGALGVPHGDEVIAIANRVIPSFELVVASQDWHPADHQTFFSAHPGKGMGDIAHVAGLDQILWPSHCVQGSPGAEFAPTLDTRKVQVIFRKGVRPAIHSYSAFFDDARRHSTHMAEYLKGAGVTDLYILGLATDYCVKYSVLDALQLGFKVKVITDGCRAVNLRPEDEINSLKAMKAAGAILIKSQEVGPAHK
jgi:nicotinamidase/pyrazinamidase